MQKQLVKAVKRAGGYTAVASEMGVTKSAVWQWVRDGHIPPLRALTFERVTGFPKEKSAPQIYPNG